MSFGFSIGDFIAIIEHTSRLRKVFVGAPSQFKELSEELRNLQIVVHDIEVDLSTADLGDCQQNELQSIKQSCCDTLTDIESMVNRYSAKEFHRLGRIWRRVTWDPDELRHLRNRVCVNVGNLNAFNGRLARTQVSDVMTNMSNEHNHLCLDWLSSTYHAIQQAEHSERRQSGTGQWFLDSQFFHEWVKMPHQTLLCLGKPGAGKTFIVSAAIDELEKLYRDIPEVGIAYIYCDFQYIHEDRQKVSRLLSSITRQLVQSMSKIPPNIVKLFDNHRNKGTRPSTNEISGVLQSLTRHFQQVFIIVDALDELNDSNRLLDEIFSLQKTGIVNFLSTARFIPEVMARFQDKPTQEIQASRQDVMSYLSASLEKMQCLSRKPELHPEIIDIISNAVDGIFLLAQLYLGSLSGKMSRKAIRAGLQSLARGSQSYEDAYDNTMRRIVNQVADQRSTALNVLSWITYAKRPLTAIELQHALAVELGESKFDEDNLSDTEDLVSVCAGLVAISADGTRDVVRLVHHTAQKYLEQKLIYWLQDSQRRIAATCITYLSYEVFATGSCLTDSAFEERLERYPLFSYAARNWGHHARVQCVDDDLLIGFLQDNSKTEACGQAIFTRKGYTNYGHYSRQISLAITGLHLTAYFGLPVATKHLLRDCSSLLPMDSIGRTPLALAAYVGHEEVVKLFLDKGVDADQTDYRGRTPITLAASEGLLEIVKLLLDYGVEPQSNKGDWRPAILWGASGGHTAVVQLLLERGASPNTQDDEKRTPLLWAAAHGWPETVQLLLERNCHPEIRDVRGRTALHEAAENGHFAVVDLLLKADSKRDLKDAKGKTPLFYAQQYGHFRTSSLLRGLSLDLEMNERMSTLQIQSVSCLPGSDQAGFKCPLCGVKTQNRGVFMRHVNDQHYPRRTYMCPMPSCRKKQHRKDKIKSHMRAHESWGKAKETEITSELPFPTTCCFCKAETDSWDAFYACYLKHSVIK